MTLKEIIVRLRRKTPAVYAGLCTARAVGAIAKYPAGERHAILAMMRSTEEEVEVAMAELLHTEGWNEVNFLEWKLLDVPFFSDDRNVTACYVSAMTSNGGYIVYAEPVEDLEAGFAGSVRN